MEKFEIIRKRRNVLLKINLAILLLIGIISLGSWTFWIGKITNLWWAVNFVALPTIGVVYLINTFLIWDIKPDLENEKIESKFYFYFKIILHILFLLYLVATFFYLMII